MVFIGAVDCEVHRLFSCLFGKNLFRMACYLLKCVKYLHFYGVKFGTLKNTL